LYACRDEERGKEEGRKRYFEKLKMILKTYEETIPAVPEKQLNIPYVVSERRLQRVAAHITGSSRRRSIFPVPSKRNNK